MNITLTLAIIAATGAVVAARAQDLDTPVAERHRRNMAFRAAINEESRLMRTRKVIDCLVEEVRSPTIATWTEAGTWHQRQLQIMLAENVGHPSLRSKFDLPTLRRAAASSRRGEERLVLTLFRGFIGDGEVAVTMLGYIADAQVPPYYRCMAANILGEFRPPAAVDVLLRVAEEDPVWQTRAKLAVINSRNSNYKAYVVRASALAALRRYEGAGLLPPPVRDRMDRVQLAEEFPEPIAAAPIKP